MSQTGLEPSISRSPVQRFTNWATGKANIHPWLDKTEFLDREDILMDDIISLLNFFTDLHGYQITPGKGG